MKLMYAVGEKFCIPVYVDHDNKLHVRNEADFCPITIESKYELKEYASVFHLFKKIELLEKMKDNLIAQKELLMKDKYNPVHIKLYLASKPFVTPEFEMVTDIIYHYSDFLAALWSNKDSELAVKLKEIDSLTDTSIDKELLRDKVFYEYYLEKKKK